MTQDIYSAYRAICQELDLPPVSAAIFETTQDSPPDFDVLLLPGADQTWIGLRADGRDGCRKCAESVGDFLAFFYPGDSAQTFTASTATRLIIALHAYNDTSIALSNFYASQNWSVFTPVALCETCSRTATQPWHLHAPTFHAPMDAPVDSDTGGSRSTHPMAFVEANRWTIGFASILGNPVPVDELKVVSLVNAPVRTHYDPTECETSGGKGVSRDQALASCVGEGMERYALCGLARGVGILTSERDMHNAVDLIHEFDLPANDTNTSITEYTPTLAVEWTPWISRRLGEERYLPANFAYCPYNAPEGVSAITVGSTNGAATGATEIDAITQGLLEVIERDAFWYYTRTSRAAMPIPPELFPMDISQAMSSIDAQFFATLLPNPFKVPVVNVSAVCGPSYRTRTARGTGATNSLANSITRAFSECVQMIHSLDSGISVSTTPSDMRNLWYTGVAETTFPNLFSNQYSSLESFEPMKAELDLSLDDLIARVHQQELEVYSYILASSTHITVAKVVTSHIAVTDSTYFRNGTRLAHFASLQGHSEPAITYRGSLFM